MAVMNPAGLGQARAPVPEDEAVDVRRDLVLAWSPGDFAVKHDVYLGTTYADVNAASPGGALMV